MGRRHHPLKEEQVVSALLLLGFRLKSNRGSHAHYTIKNARGKFRKVTVDGHLAPFSQDLIHMMAHQAGLTVKELYAAVDGATPSSWP